MELKTWLKLADGKCKTVWRSVAGLAHVLAKLHYLGIFSLPISFTGHKRRTSFNDARNKGGSHATYVQFTEPFYSPVSGSIIMGNSLGIYEIGARLRGLIQSGDTLAVKIKICIDASSSFGGAHA